MDEHQILTLVDREHELRTLLQRGDLSSETERERLVAIEGALDQCWDLPRRRRARREFRQSTGDVELRSVEQVEKYLQ